MLTFLCPFVAIETKSWSLDCSHNTVIKIKSNVLKLYSDILDIIISDKLDVDLSMTFVIIETNSWSLWLVSMVQPQRLITEILNYWDIFHINMSGKFDANLCDLQI